MKENILVTGLVREQYEREYTSNSFVDISIKFKHSFPYNITNIHVV